MTVRKTCAFELRNPLAGVSTALGLPHLNELTLLPSGMHWCWLLLSYDSICTESTSHLSFHFVDRAGCNRPGDGNAHEKRNCFLQLWS